MVVVVQAFVSVKKDFHPNNEIQIFPICFEVFAGARTYPIAPTRVDTLHKYCICNAARLY